MLLGHFLQGCWINPLAISQPVESNDKIDTCMFSYAVPSGQREMHYFLFLQFFGLDMERVQ